VRVNDDDNPMNYNDQEGLRKITTGWRTVDGHPGAPSGGRDAWRSAMTSCGKLHPATKRRMDAP